MMVWTICTQNMLLCAKQKEPSYPCCFTVFYSDMFSYNFEFFMDRIYKYKLSLVAHHTEGFAVLFFLKLRFMSEKLYQQLK